MFIENLEQKNGFKFNDTVNKGYASITTNTTTSKSHIFLNMMGSSVIRLL